MCNKRCQGVSVKGNSGQQKAWKDEYFGGRGGNRTHQGQCDCPPHGFEGRDRHQTTSASGWIILHLAISVKRSIGKAVSAKSN